MRVLAFIISIFSLGAFAADQPAQLMGFKDESELGAAIVSGNTSSETYTLKQSNFYGWDNNVLKLTGRYLNTRSTTGTGPAQTGLADTARAWDASLRYERVLTEMLNVFTSYGLESDVFNGYVQRNDFDLGGKYFLTKNEDTLWSVEAGYRNIMTHYPSAAQTDLTTNNVRVYSEVTYNLTKTASAKVWVEYIQALSSNLTAPGYSVGQDYQINTEPSITVAISAVFSLKAAYLFKYMDYIPQGSTATKYLDTVFSTTLMAKF